MKNKNQLTEHIKTYLEKTFGQRKYFALIYGSFVNGMRNFNSDIDLCVIAEKFSTNEMRALKQFVLDFHRKNNLIIDNEVPFENKLMISYQDAEDAAYMACFEVNNNKITVPLIKKTKVFLKSRDVKLRLILNALTSPHIVMGNDLDFYKRLRNLSERNILLLIKSWTQHINEKSENPLTILFTSQSGEEGEMYLGYKRYPLVKKYIKSWLNKQIDNLAGIDMAKEWNNLCEQAKKRSVMTKFLS